MIEILCGTNRPNSNSMKVCHILKGLLEKNNAPCEILNLQEVPLDQLNGQQYSENKPEGLIKMIERVNAADGVFFCCSRI